MDIKFTSFQIIIYLGHPALLELVMMPAETSGGSD